MRTRTFLAALAASFAVAVPVAAQAGASARRVVGNCTHSQVRPSSIIVACADANLSLTHLRWRTFGGKSAHGSGDYYVNDCTPNCAGGKFRTYAIKVVLSAAMPCKDHFDDYRTAAVTFTGARPTGQHSAHAKLGLSCPIP